MAFTKYILLLHPNNVEENTSLITDEFKKFFLARIPENVFWH